MNSNSFKTLSLRKEDVDKQWLLVDATDQNLGRMCSNIAKILRGKHKPTFTPHVDCGDYIIVVNANKVNLTGNKWENKTYISHSGYPGGQKVKTARQVFDKNPSDLIERAVKGMLPKNKLGKSIIKKLKVFKGSEHSHESQQPIEWNPSS